MIGGILFSFIMIRTLPRFSVFRTLVLNAQTQAAEGYVSASTEYDTELLGLQGVTLTELRPVGIGMFDGRRLDIITEGQFIQSQAAVKIVSAHGSRIVVRPM